MYAYAGSDPIAQYDPNAFDLVQLPMAQRPTQAVEKLAATEAGARAMDAMRSSDTHFIISDQVATFDNGKPYPFGIPGQTSADPKTATVNIKLNLANYDENLPSAYTGMKVDDPFVAAHEIIRHGLSFTGPTNTWKQPTEKDEIAADKAAAEALGRLPEGRTAEPNALSPPPPPPPPVAPPVVPTFPIETRFDLPEFRDSPP